MRKKILVKEAGFIEFVRSFFKAKSGGNEKEYIQKLRKASPDLADAWSDWDQKADDMLLTIKKNYLKKGKLDKAKEIDDIIAKYK